MTSIQSDQSSRACSSSMTLEATKTTTLDLSQLALGYLAPLEQNASDSKLKASHSKKKSLWQILHSSKNKVGKSSSLERLKESIHSFASPPRTPREKQWKPEIPSLSLIYNLEHWKSFDDSQKREAMNELSKQPVDSKVWIEVILKSGKAEQDLTNRIHLAQMLSLCHEEKLTELESKLHFLLDSQGSYRELLQSCFNEDPEHKKLFGYLPVNLKKEICNILDTEANYGLSPRSSILDDYITLARLRTCLTPYISEGTISEIINKEIKFIFNTSSQALEHFSTPPKELNSKLRNYTQSLWVYRNSLQKEEEQHSFDKNIFNTGIPALSFHYLQFVEDNPSHPPMLQALKGLTLTYFDWEWKLLSPDLNQRSIELYLTLNSYYTHASFLSDKGLLANAQHVNDLLFAFKKEASSWKSSLEKSAKKFFKERQQRSNKPCYDHWIATFGDPTLTAEYLKLIKPKAWLEKGSPKMSLLEGVFRIHSKLGTLNKLIARLNLSYDDIAKADIDGRQRPLLRDLYTDPEAFDRHMVTHKDPRVAAEYLEGLDNDQRSSFTQSVLTIHTAQGTLFELLRQLKCTTETFRASEAAFGSLLSLLARNSELAADSKNVLFPRFPKDPKEAELLLEEPKLSEFFEENTRLTLKLIETHNTSLLIDVLRALAREKKEIPRDHIAQVIFLNAVNGTLSIEAFKKAKLSYQTPQGELFKKYLAHSQKLILNAFDKEDSKLQSLEKEAKSIVSKALGF